MTNAHDIKKIAGINLYQVTMVDGDGVSAQGPDFQYKQREHFMHELKSFLTSTELLHQILKELDPSKIDIHSYDPDTLVKYNFIVENYNLFYQLTLAKAMEMVQFIFSTMTYDVIKINTQKHSTTAINLGNRVANLLNDLETLTITTETPRVVGVKIVSDVDIIAHMNELTKLHPDFTFTIHLVTRFNYVEPEYRYFQNGEELFPNSLVNKLQSMTDDEVKKTMTELAKKSYDIGLVYVFDAYNHFLNAEVSNSPEGMELLHEMELTSNELRRRKLVPTIEEINKKLSQFFKHAGSPQW